MQSDAYYYDIILDKNVCKKFEASGYCPDLSACKYFHRQKAEEDDMFNMIKLPPPPPVFKQPKQNFSEDGIFIPPPPPVFNQPKQNFSDAIPLPPPPPSSFKPYVPPGFSQENINLVSKFPLPPPPPPINPLPYMQLPRPKIDLMPSLRSRFKAAQVPVKPMPCHFCHRQQPQPNLFCNSFCGHLFCYDCVSRHKMCQQCGIQFDTQTAKTFFQSYCPRCDKQNAKKLDEKVCKDCRFEEEVYEMKLKKEQEQLEKLSQSTLNMHCIICMNRKKEFAVFPCAHMLYCEDCIETVKRNNACFFCNTKINHSTKIFY